MEPLFEVKSVMTQELVRAGQKAYLRITPAKTALCYLTSTVCAGLVAFCIVAELLAAAIKPLLTVCMSFA